MTRLAWPSVPSVLLALAVAACSLDRSGLGGGIDPVDCPPGFWDGNRDPADGCEYACVPTSPPEEVCDLVDNDCDPMTPDGVLDPLVGVTCDGPDLDLCPEGRALCLGGRAVCEDATDTNVEHCDAEDDDCDGVVDEDPVDGVPFPIDRDGDLHGDRVETILACRVGGGAAAAPDDCDDLDRERHPGATETCNGADDDCDGFTDEGGKCGCVGEMGFGHVYLFCRSTRDWPGAQADCASRSHHMVTIGSAEENEWLATRARSYVDTSWWTGFNDRADEDAWGWEDGSAIPYVNWLDGEPNDGGGGWWGDMPPPEDCGELLVGDGKWNDYRCDQDHPYVCEQGG